MSLSSKSAIVTGGASGLGKAIAETFLKAGAKVLIVDIHPERLQSTSEELSPHGELHTFKADITSESAVEEVFAAAKEKLGGVDVLVNNAGIMDWFDPVGTVKKDYWDKVIAINLTAPMLMSKYAVKAMEGKTGVILNVGSAAGTMGLKAGAAYTASKHGLIGLTKNTAAFYSTRGIRCNLIGPGGMQTNIHENLEANINYEGFVATGQDKARPPMCDLKDMASLALFLCSDASAVLNGACIPADKGWAAF